MTDDAPEAPAANKNFVDAEHRAPVAILKKRSPTEWAKAVKELTIPIPPERLDGGEQLITMEHVRAAAAALAWWDFFGHRKASQRWNHLDKYLNRTFVRVPRELLVAALIALGYPEPWARARTKEQPVQSHRPKIKKEN